MFPDRQGCGIGRALIAHVEEEARRLGLNAVELYTNEKMTENLGLYSRLGYIETGRRNEDGFNRVFFRKALVNCRDRSDLFHISMYLAIPYWSA